MNDRHEDEMRMEEMFRAARRADEASAPPFESVRRAPGPLSPSAMSLRRALRIAAATSFACVTLISTAWLTFVDRDSTRQPFEPVQVTVLKYTPPPAPARVETTEPQSRVQPKFAPAPRPKPKRSAPERKVAAPLEIAPELPKPPDMSEVAVQFSDEYIQDLPVPGRSYQNVVTLAPGVQDADGDGNPNVHASRSRDFKAVVSGVSNVDPLTGQQMSQVNPNSIEEMEVISGGAGVQFSRAQGGFARIILKQGDDEQDTTRLDTESYDVVKENEFRAVADHPLSTFSIDVDTASYANVRRFLNTGVRPPVDAVRIEEMINYFDYDYEPPAGDVPFSADVEVAECPWNPQHRLARIGLKGREIDRGELAGTNLVFLIDVSGSMQPPNKLPLLKKALRLLVRQLDGRDQVAMVVYAGSSGLVLPSTSGADTATILEALDRLEAGGSTNGGAGLRLAYRIAREHFIEGGVNRVILATDGDFNVGVTHRSNLLKLIKADADRGIFLTALGVGMGNYKDGTLELLADKGNGNYAYIDTLNEARKVLVEEIGGTLVTIAKDVKIQVEFNPVEVGAYRLIGYENRMLAKEDFNDDTKDAGEIGAGHTVTALYELVPPGGEGSGGGVDPLKYQASAALSKAARGGELFTLKLRYKEPGGDASKLLSFPVVDQGLPLQAASSEFKFASGVAMFGMILRESAHKGTATLGDVQRLCLEGAGVDAHGYRAEMQELVLKAMAIE